MSEHSRTADMIKAPETKYGDQYDISLFSDSSNYCPFCGGGDIGILKKDFTAAALLQGSMPESEELTAELELPSQMEIPTSAQLFSQQQIASSPQESGLQSLAESPAQELQLTPTKEGDYRCGAIENKVTHAQQETAACMQLQANMLLLCSKLLVHKVLNDTDSADITLLTSYGVLLGPTYALKMTLNFDNGALLYEELFKLDPCLHYPAFVGMCIFFVY